MKTLALALGATLLLSGCLATPKKLKTYQEYHPQVNAVYDSFEKKTTIQGPKLAYYNYDFNDTGFYVLRNYYRIERETHQIYVARMYVDAKWRYYYKAIDQDGNVLQFDRVTTDVGCNSYGSCTYTEEIVLTLSDKKYLKKYRDTGLLIRMYGRHGPDDVINIRPSIIKWHLQYLEEQSWQQ